MRKFFGKNFQKFDFLFSHRIIGGKPIKIEEAPYQAGLYYNDRFLCGGAVISKNFVITAAHCVNCPFCEPENFNVMVGTSNRNDKNAVKIPVKKVIMHPEYSADFYSYDIAILELKDARQLPKHVLYAELPSDEIHQDDPMFITGWGRTENGLLSDVLMGVVVPVYNQTKCEEIYDEQRIEITDKMFCAGLEEGGVDSCQGKIFLKKSFKNFKRKNYY